MPKSVHFIILLLGICFSKAEANSFKFMSLNVGGGEYTTDWGLEVEPVCPAYKLCDTEVIERIRLHVQTHEPDVIFFQEILDPLQLTHGMNGQKPLLPNGYLVACGVGAAGLKEVCTAWKKESVKLVGQRCLAYSALEGGVVRCTFSIFSVEVDFVNVHASAWNTEDREFLLSTMWRAFVNNKRRTVVAGDFNTETGTYDGKYPYPKEFGTVFGRFVRGYGRWKAANTFFGRLFVDDYGSLKNRPADGSTVVRDKIDHIFANFGEIPKKSSKLACQWMVCLGNKEGYDWGNAMWQWGSTWGPKIDHLPILVEFHLE